MEESLHIARILGPVLLALSTTEYRNFDIWRSIHPTVVYLNGLVLLIAGLTILSFHNSWHLDWTLLVTLFGWVLTALGLLRMMFPKATQIENKSIANLVFAAMFASGLFLSLKSIMLV